MRNPQGNTADKVLATCDCSILTVKPDDFVSPINPASWPLQPGPGSESTNRSLELLLSIRWLTPSVRLGLVGEQDAHPEMQHLAVKKSKISRLGDRNVNPLIKSRCSMNVPINCFDIISLDIYSHGYSL